MATPKPETIKLTDHLEKRRAGKPFSVELGDGAVFTIPDIKGLPYKTLRSLDSLAEDDALAALMGKEQSVAFLDHPEVDGYYVEDFMNTWRAHAGLPGGPGESPASST